MTGNLQQTLHMMHTCSFWTTYHNEKENTRT